MNYAAVPAFDARPSSWTLLHQVYILYREHHRKFAAITIPAALFAAFAISVCHTEGAYLASRAPKGLEILYHRWQYAQILGVGAMGFFLPWFFGCFAFAATATVVRNLLSQEDGQVDIGDGYARARECILPILLFSALTFLIVALGFTAGTWLGGNVMVRISNHHVSRFAYWMVALAGWLLAIAFVTRYALALPSIVHKKVGALQAMRSTVALTEGYDGYLFLLAMESFVGTIVASYAAAFFVMLLLQRAPLIESPWSEWIIIVAAVLASALVEPPMFIGFSLLYFEQTRERQPQPITSASFLPRSQQPPYHH